MIHVLSADNAHLHQDTLDACFRLRHRVFVETRGWSDLARPDGREIDQFDTASAVHFVSTDRHGCILAYARLLPTTGPHLLADVYPQLCARAEIPRGPQIAEWTRHLVNPDAVRGAAAVQASNALILGILEWCHARGITHATCQGDPLWITRTLQLGFGVEPLGLPLEIGGETVIALLFEIGERAIRRTRAVCARGVRAMPAHEGRRPAESPADLPVVLPDGRSGDLRV
ncbi:acyl-homoserine-lactone synthase [Methylobrevis pamukkalensis]|uniref:Acyl-homoserine-lactone synthase n=1 Tax=Methylobrevis pamukkalensis TaxID=1439726 RepID=A0A1E3H8B1_9HYPH|nr:acyl-homoserine-lactone synthase [Methylobrevis pamukkalensis]ODN72569.1 Isovaleryl-homoserine lactone synthase [Methylobrevis pamukkalensis]